MDSGSWTDMISWSLIYLFKNRSIDENHFFGILCTMSPWKTLGTCVFLRIKLKVSFKKITTTGITISTLLGIRAEYKRPVTFQPDFMQLSREAREHIFGPKSHLYPIEINPQSISWQFGEIHSCGWSLVLGLHAHVLDRLPQHLRMMFFFASSAQHSLNYPCNRLVVLVSTLSTVQGMEHP